MFIKRELLHEFFNLKLNTIGRHWKKRHSFSAVFKLGGNGIVRYLVLILVFHKNQIAVDGRPGLGRARFRWMIRTKIMKTMEMMEMMDWIEPGGGSWRPWVWHGARIISSAPWRNAAGRCKMSASLRRRSNSTAKDASRTTWRHVAVAVRSASKAYVFSYNNWVRFNNW